MVKDRVGGANNYVGVVYRAGDLMLISHLWRLGLAWWPDGLVDQLGNCQVVVVGSERKQIAICRSEAHSKQVGDECAGDGDLLAVSDDQRGSVRAVQCCHPFLCLTGRGLTAYNNHRAVQPYIPRRSRLAGRDWHFYGLNIQRSPYLRSDSQVGGFDLAPCGASGKLWVIWSDLSLDRPTYVFFNQESKRRSYRRTAIGSTNERL